MAAPAQDLPPYTLESLIGQLGHEVGRLTRIALRHADRLDAAPWVLESFWRWRFRRSVRELRRCLAARDAMVSSAAVIEETECVWPQQVVSLAA